MILMRIKMFLSAVLAISSITIITMSMSQNDQPTGLNLNVRGDKELGIVLELPFLNDSPADVIITNNGQHSLLAYKIRWEGIKYSGEVVERQSIKYHPDALLEADLEKRQEILNRQPLLPPNTKWFVGLGRVNKRITDKVPTLDEVGRDPELFPDLKEYKQINVTLDAAMLENGEVIGRDPIAFDKEIKGILSNNFTPSKEKN
jgi:hypothetical protein